MDVKGLAGYRTSLNDLDEQLIELLGKRIDVCRDVAQFKRENSIPMMQGKRVDQVKARCAELALAHQVDPDFVRKLYTMIIDETCRVEDEIIGST